MFILQFYWNIALNEHTVNIAKLKFICACSLKNFKNFLLEFYINLRLAVAATLDCGQGIHLMIILTKFNSNWACSSKQRRTFKKKIPPFFHIYNNGCHIGWQIMTLDKFLKGLFPFGANCPVVYNMKCWSTMDRQQMMDNERQMMIKAHTAF